ncbi:hypothetical protein BDV93DRAFT_499278 [Ceratobasidium sp. AG-I]|nr:hypothetical protein BDV93DRAFT_499278 [Ceratobasidium sp. AG-I]
MIFSNPRTSLLPVPEQTRHNVHRPQTYPVTTPPAIRTFLVHIPLISHFLVTVGLALASILVLDGQAFNISSRNPMVIQADRSRQSSGNLKLLQSDVTTFLSAALVIIRMLVTSWCGIAGWRAAFILLEHGEITVSELSLLAQYQIPPIWRRRRFKGDSGVYLSIIVALLLPFLAQISAPVLSGSIAWLPALDYVNGNLNLQNIAGGGLGQNWESMQFWGEGSITKRSNSSQCIRSWGPGSSENIQGPTAFRRVAPSAHALPINTTLANVTLPFFEAHSIQWLNDTELANLDPVLRDAIKSSSTVLSYGSGGNPMWDAPTGNVALLKNTTWVANYTFPPSLTVEGEFYMVMKVGKNPDGPDCAETQSLYYGPESPSMAYAMNRFSDTNTTNCYGFARIQIRAGVAQCYDCRIAAPLIVQNTSEITLVPDEMTQEALYMLPAITHRIVTQNASLTPCYNNLNEYVISTLAQGYSGAWTALTANLGAPLLETSVRIPILVSRAQVDPIRVWIWLGTHLCLTLSGILLLRVQSRCAHAIVMNPVLAPLFLDTTEFKSHREDPDDWVLTNGTGSLREATVKLKRRENGTQG